MLTANLCIHWPLSLRSLNWDFRCCEWLGAVACFMRPLGSGSWGYGHVISYCSVLEPWNSKMSPANNSVENVWKKWRPVELAFTVYLCSDVSGTRTRSRKWHFFKGQAKSNSNSQTSRVKPGGKWEAFRYLSYTCLLLPRGLCRRLARSVWLGNYTSV